jgi:hypothetical protein
MINTIRWDSQASEPEQNCVRYAGGGGLLWQYGRNAKAFRSEMPSCNW